jgi:hypothetical protein
VTWQLSTLPSVPDHCRFTPGECSPSFFTPVSSTTQATRPSPGTTRSAQALISNAESQRESTQKLLHRPVTRAVLAEAKQRRLQALAAPLLDQPTHVQERVLAPAGIPANKVLLVGA